MFLGLFSGDILWNENGVPQNMDFKARIKKTNTKTEDNRCQGTGQKT